MKSLNINRVRKRFEETYGSYIEPSNDNNYGFETRALASLALMIKCGLDEYTSSIHITDGYHDMGIDAIYLDETQKTLFLVQSKWRNDGSGSIRQEEMNSFVSGIKRIINFELDGANDKIIAKKDDIEKALDGIGYKIEAVYIHTGNAEINDFIMRPMNELLNASNDEAGDILHFSQIAFKDVYEYLATAGGSVDIMLDNVILSNWGKIDEPYLAYYGTVSASAIGEWYMTYGNKLFAQNIRFYKGRTDVNEGIRKVLLKEPEKFIYYNNGIKLLCKKIERKAKNSTTNETGIFTLQGVTLINGAQTTGCIGTVFLEDCNKLEKVKVMIQMIDMNGIEDEEAKQITKLSNTQNRIENKDFASQDPTQERIKRELAFSNYQYLYKTGDDVIDYSSQLSFDEAIIALACLSDDISYTTIAKRNVGALSENISKPPYKALFNDSTNAYELLNSVLIIREVERILQLLKGTFSGKAYAACVHGNRLIEHMVLLKMRTDKSFQSSVMGIPSGSVEIKSAVEKIIPEVTSELENTYADSYPANVFKNQSKVKAICDKLKEHMN